MNAEKRNTQRIFSDEVMGNHLCRIFDNGWVDDALFNGLKFWFGLESSLKLG